MVLIAAALAAQDRPDFSGRWILAAGQQEGSDVPRALSVRQSLVRTNVRGEPMTPYFKDISIEREFASATRSETHAIGIVGGFVSGTVGSGTPAGSRGHRAVKWDGNALVFESATYTGDVRESGEWGERRETWSLDPDGRLRITITSRSSADVSGTATTHTYRRP